MKLIATAFICALFFSFSIAELPPKNKIIVHVCDSLKGKKVGRGECWDLAKFALDRAGAVWEAPYKFGRALGKKESLLPGDILQFEGVRIENADGSGMSLPHHTAIVHDVKSATDIEIAEQNSANRKFVVFTTLDLAAIRKGRYTAYRPQ